MNDPLEHIVIEKTRYTDNTPELPEDLPDYEYWSDTGDDEEELQEELHGELGGLHIYDPEESEEEPEEEEPYTPEEDDEEDTEEEEFGEEEPEEEESEPEPEEDSEEAEPEEEWEPIITRDTTLEVLEQEATKEETEEPPHRPKRIRDTKRIVQAPPAVERRQRRRSRAPRGRFVRHLSE